HVFSVACHVFSVGACGRMDTPDVDLALLLHFFPFPHLSIWTIINLHFSTQMISSKPLIINRLFLH
ncbi:MAG: hypothetical protein C7N36_21355, partial [Bacteroidetes bacterium]